MRATVRLPRASRVAIFAAESGSTRRLSAGGSQQRRATQQNGIVGQKTERESSGITPWRRNDRIDEEVTRGQTELTRSSTRTERGVEKGVTGPLLRRGKRALLAGLSRTQCRRGAPHTPPWGASRPTRLARTNRGVLGAKVGSTWSRQGIHLVLLLVLVGRRGCFARGILRTPPVGGFFTFAFRRRSCAIGDGGCYFGTARRELLPFPLGFSERALPPLPLPSVWGAAAPSCCCSICRALP